MWILFKLFGKLFGVLAVLGFRFLQKGPGLSRPDGTHDGIPYYQSVMENRRRGIIYSHRITIPAKSPFAVSFHFETSVDRFFKSLGFANEIQTGDSQFDSKIYVTCDHTGVRELIRSHDGLRQAILNLLKDRRSPQLVSDGKFLILRAQGEPHESVQQMAEALINFQKLFEQATSQIRWAPFWKDPFFYRALGAETLVWGLAGYGISNGLELVFSSESQILRPMALLGPSLLSGVLMTAAGVFLLMHWFKGSSRPHRILAEAGIVLSIGMPFLAFHLTSEWNQRMDLSSPVEEVRPIVDIQEKRHTSQRRRGVSRTTYTYHALFAPSTQLNSPLPESYWQEIPNHTYQQIQTKQIQSVKLVLGRGRLGVPWLKSLEFLNTPPSP